MNSRYSTLFRYGVAAGSGVLVAMLIAAEPIPLRWMLSILLLLSLTAVATIKSPATILVPVIFIPQWKTIPALQPIQEHLDLTVVALIVLTVVVLLQLTHALHSETFHGLFAGEAFGIATFFLFVGVVAFSYLYTAAPNWGMTQTTRLLFIGGLLLLTPFVLIRREKDFRQFCAVFVFFSVVRALQIMLFPEYGKGGEFEHIVKTDIGAAWLIGMAILIVLYYDWLSSSRARMMAKLVCLPVLSAGIVAATARGAILGLIFVVICVALLRPRNPYRRSSMLASLGITIVAITGMWIALSSLWWTQARLNEKTTELLDILQGSTPGSGSAVERLAFYKAAMREIGERPLAGLGVGGWAVYFSGRDEREYPHNLLLLIGVEQGLLGIAAFCLFLVAVGSALRRIINATGDRYFVLFALVLFSLTVSMFSGDLDTNRMLWFWCGMSLAFARLVRLSIEWRSLTTPIMHGALRRYAIGASITHSHI